MSHRPQFAVPVASERLQRLEQTPRWLAYLVAAVLVVAAATADHYAGRDLATGFLYVPAVAGLGWLLGHRAGLHAAAAATVAGLLVDWPFAAPNAEGVVLWNVVATGLLLGAAGWFAGEVRAHRDWIRHVTHVDGLTGLYNRASFLVAVDAELARSERYGGDTTLLCIDVERLRDVNATRGHAAGDALLKGLAAELGEKLRRTDLLARVGDDEFAVLLRATSAESAPAVAQKLGETLSAWAAAHDWPVTFGLGWASAPFTGMNAEALIERATATLYERRRALRGGAAVAGVSAKTAYA